MERKAQIRMGESVAVIVVVTLILIVGIVIYFNVSKGHAEDKSRKFEEYNIISVTQRVSALPEMQKSTQGVSKMVTLDKQRITALKQVIDEAEPGSRITSYYRTVFGTSHIYVEEIYNEGASGKIFEIYNNTPETFRSMTPARLYVSIYDSLKDRYGFGVLVVEQYYG